MASWPRVLLTVAFPALLLAACQGDSAKRVDVTGRILFPGNWCRDLPTVKIMVRSSPDFLVVTTAEQDAGYIFHVPNVPVPYELGTLVSNEATLSVGLNGPTTEIRVSGGESAGCLPDGFEGVVTGSVEGADLSGDSSYFVGFVSPDVSRWERPVTPDFRVQFSFPRAVSQLTGTVYAFQARVDGGYLLGASRPLTLTAGQPADAQVLSLLAGGATLTLTGTYEPPSGYIVGEKILSMITDGTEVGLSLDTSADTRFAFSAPAIPGATLVLNVYSTSSVEPPFENSSVRYERIGAGAGGAIALSSPRAPTLLAPDPDSTGVGPGTVFAWTPVDGGTYELRLGPSDGVRTGGTFIGVYSNEPRVSFPDLTPLGVSVPSTAGYFWFVNVRDPEGRFGAQSRSRTFVTGR